MELSLKDLLLIDQYLLLKCPLLWWQWLLREFLILVVIILLWRIEIRLDHLNDPVLSTLRWILSHGWRLVITAILLFHMLFKHNVVNVLICLVSLLTLATEDRVSELLTSLILSSLCFYHDHLHLLLTLTTVRVALYSLEHHVFLKSATV
jgi:hypothetical protein